MRKFPKLLSFLLLLLAFGCAPKPYYVTPSDWNPPEKKDSVIKFYSQFLKGWKIFIDPGHGGQDRRSVGIKKRVVEADVNLKVALYLRDYLTQAGATVFMSRDKDTTVSLQDRVKMATESGADIFISIHHNASPGDPNTYYASTWYHAVEGDPRFHPSNKDIARYIQRDLAYALRISGSLASFDGTMSDYIIYPKQGFYVLRNATMPAVLVECTFFTNEYEERKLSIDEFNQIEAWGIFKGLAKYIQAGVPKLELLSDTILTSATPTIMIKASDKSGIDKESIKIKIDSLQVDRNSITTIDAQNFSIILFTPNFKLTDGIHKLDVVVRNKNGNSSFPFRKNIYILKQRG
ncbi:MAG: N-acetylmuramoyl-L-alanine amidase [Candidatus Kryptonium sp.]